jgi:hypothetical protein
VTYESSGIQKPYYIFKHFTKLNSPIKLFMFQSNQSISSTPISSLCKANGRPVSKKAALTQTAAVLDLQKFTQLCCGNGGGAEGFLNNWSLLGPYVAVAVTGDTVHCTI